MPSKRVDKINEFMTETFAENRIEDTTENRLAFMLGLKRAWEENNADKASWEECIERMGYGIAIDGQIFHLKMKLMWDR